MPGAVPVTGGCRCWGTTLTDAGRDAGDAVPVPVEWGIPIRGCASGGTGRCHPGTGRGLPVPVGVLGRGCRCRDGGMPLLDLLLRPPVPQVQEIVFRNFYTAFLSVRVQRPGPGGSRRWVTCLRNLCLMPCPHTEEGSQDYFCLHRHQMLCDVDQVTAMRFILRQPSPVWLHFTIEDLQIFPPGQKSPQKDFPSWLSQLTPPEQPASLHGELPDPEKVSTEVQQMWVLTEVIRARQAAARIGRFDVDGCYDVNLLSYT
ncbi:nicolin-1 isoform X1 [Poecile atricapillus]|uniref:nicolin-1 isoform X1 n=1 Tax=Poecile atricapillus TaxID=48891 RepID=UPI002738B227|nr:nicolin-1 isoform X1 [Poecile atricapillus]